MLSIPWEHPAKPVAHGCGVPSPVFPSQDSLDKAQGVLADVD